MGKKLAPLRKIFAKGGESGASGDSSLGKRDQTTDSSAKSAATKEKAKRAKTDDGDDVDWEKLEAEQDAEGASSGSDDEDDEESEDGDGIRLDGNLEHVVEDYTFEFNDMKDEYSEGICTMLRKFIANPTEAYSLATVVTAQTVVGTVVNCEGGQDSFAFATILPFKKIERVAAVRGIMENLVTGLDQLLRTTPNEDIKLLKDCLASAASDKASSSSAAAKAPKTNSVHAARTGLLLHKRFTNLPIQLVGALHRNLEEDVSWAQQQATDDDEEVVESTSSSGQKASKTSQGGNFFAEARNVVLFCECAVSKEGKSAYTLGEGNTCYNVLGSCSDIIFACFEDEVYLQHATAAVLFRPAKTLCTTDLVALLVPISKLKKCANGICELIPE